MRRSRVSCSRVGSPGFTLIEILLSMLIFLSGVAGIYALLSTGLAMQKQGLEIGHQTRRLEEVVTVLERQVAEGQHFDQAAGAWKDVPSARLEDGTFYSVEFRPEPGNEAEGTLLARVRVASSEAGLLAARPLDWVLTPGPSVAVMARRQQAKGP